MPTTFSPNAPDQGFLLPRNFREWLREDHHGLFGAVVTHARGHALIDHHRVLAMVVK